MAHLTARDSSAVLQTVADLHAGANADDAVSTLPVLMLGLLSRLVRSTTSAFTQVDPVLGETSGHMLPSRGPSSGSPRGSRPTWPTTR